MKILGLCLNDWNTSAAAVVDGRVVAAAREERFNRERATRRFPAGALSYCLEASGLAVDDFDAVAAPVNPLLYLDAAGPAYAERARFRGELLYAYPAFLASRAPFRVDGTSVLAGRGAAGERRIHYVTHHDAHAALAYHGSGFAHAAVLTLDAFGEQDSTVGYAAASDGLRRIGAVRFPHSLGCFYAALTAYLGFKPFDEEWKVMAAAALGDPEVLLPRIRSLVRLGEGFSFAMDLAPFEHYLFHTPALFSPELVALLGPSYGRDPSQRDQRFFDVAAAAQRTLEEVVLELARRLLAQTGAHDLCLAGGVALNCVLNGKLAERLPIDRLYVPAMPDDSGGSVGAALAVARELGECAIEPLTHAYHGPAYAADRIRAELARFGLAWREVDDLAAATAESIAAGKLVGWFQGRMEFGDRALGARSILAHPGRADVAARLRATVKPREEFQPFAPAVVAERAAELFAGRFPSPFMERIAHARPRHRAALAAVTHVDGSARVQTVAHASNPEFHAVLTALEPRVGVPAALNTSFNVSGEPIVCTPADAVRTFFASGLDVLVLGPCILTK